MLSCNDCFTHFYSFFFFFQAEDGIRDLYVTGVQTCALPISSSNARPLRRSRRRPPSPPPRATASDAAHHASTSSRSDVIWKRSEERRVGKECRSRWSLYH